MTHNPCLTCLNASIDFPLFYNRLASHKKAHLCSCSGVALPKQHTLVGADSYTSCSSPLFLSTLLALSLLLIVASLNTFLVYSTLGVLLHDCC
ncbi:unnamed protein product [Hymenolepis diminuta]|uniref:Uncharacterized protein n=1 Tax=Hymenolepis diminuta TaxID=6216 RepID=A0A564Z9E7_HYMDI|nr:unnamed protein product [Hymenolepis diminuta]